MSESPMFGGKTESEKKKLDSSNQDTSSIKEQKTEETFLEELRLMQTKFLFLYGDHKAGKSAICSTLIYSMMTNPEVGSLIERGKQDAAGQTFVDKSIAKIRTKRFLPRTDQDSVTLAGGKFRPKNDHFNPIHITFMEMAGEELKNLVAPKGTAGFPKHIDLFLNDKQLDLVFMLVIRHDTTSAEKDLMLSNFIDYLRTKDDRFQKSKILMMVSQWDNYKGDLNVENFVQEFLPLTYACLASSSNSIMAYSVGEVTTVDNEPYISKLNTENPIKLIRWIYETITVMTSCGSLCGKGSLTLPAEMNSALSIFGTPDGFDFQTVGADFLCGLDLVKKFDGIGFSKLDFPIRSSAWGMFRRNTSAGGISGVCLTERVYENTGNRPGGFCGVGIFLCDALGDGLLLAKSLRDFHSIFSDIAIDPSSNSFVQPKIDKLQGINPPESFNSFSRSLTNANKVADIDLVVIPNICISCSDSSIDQVVDFLIKAQDYLGDYSVMLVANDQSTKLFEKAKIQVVSSLEFIEQVKEAISKAIEQARQRAIEIKIAKDKADAESARLELLRKREAERPVYEILQPSLNQESFSKEKEKTNGKNGSNSAKSTKNTFSRRQLDDAVDKAVDELYFELSAAKRKALMWQVPVLTILLLLFGTFGFFIGNITNKSDQKNREFIEQIESLRKSNAAYESELSFHKDLASQLKGENSELKSVLSKVAATEATKNKPAAVSKSAKPATQTESKKPAKAAEPNKLVTPETQDK